MHELSIAQSIITIVEKSLPADFSGEVESVGLQLGSLSGIEVDALTFSFSILREKSRIPAACLTIEKIPAKARCKECSNEFFIPAFGFPCPQCASFRYLIIQGKEMKVINISTSDK